MDTDNNSNENGRVQYGLRMEADLHAALTEMATEEDRPLSNMIQRLLKTHPLVKERLEQAEAVAA